MRRENGLAFFHLSPLGGKDEDANPEPPATAQINLKDSLSENQAMIRKLPSGKYRLYSRKKNPKTGRRRNLGTFSSRAAAERHERAVQYFKRH
jgi:hypothetical protein